MKTCLIFVALVAVLGHDVSPICPTSDTAAVGYCYNFTDPILCKSQCQISRFDIEKYCYLNFPLDAQETCQERFYVAYDRENLNCPKSKIWKFCARFYDPNDCLTVCVSRAPPMPSNAKKKGFGLLHSLHS